MGKVTFIQYCRPHGKKQFTYIELEDEYCEMARRLKQQGYELAVELVPAGMMCAREMVSLTCQLDSDDEVGFIELVPNDASVPDAVRRLITNAYKGEE